MTQLSFRQTVHIGLSVGALMLTLTASGAMGYMYWQNTIEHEMTAHNEISRAANNVISLVGFTSREMAHQVLSDADERVEQKPHLLHYRTRLQEAARHLQTLPMNEQVQNDVEHVLEEMKVFHSHVDDVVRFAEEGNTAEAFKVLDVSEELEDDMLADLTTVSSFRKPETTAYGFYFLYFFSRFWHNPSSWSYQQPFYWPQNTELYGRYGFKSP